MVMHEFARGNYHINGIEPFRPYAKRRRAKFNVFPDKRSLGWWLPGFGNYSIEVKT